MKPQEDTGRDALASRKFAPAVWGGIGEAQWSDPKVERPKVSVIVPTYNHDAYVGETIESVLSQTYEPIELVLTDDGSTDGTVAVLQDYAARGPARVKLVTSERNTGIAANFNRGLAIHSGDLIAWLGGDDLMLPEKVERQVEALAGRPEAVACCHDAEVFDSESGRPLGLFSELHNGKAGVHGGGVELLFDPAYMMLPSTMMIRSAACPPHGFDERLRFANDWLFDIEVLRRGRIVAIDEALTRYRRHTANVTDSSALSESALEEQLLVLAIVRARYPELHRLALDRTTGFLLVEAKRCREAGDRRRALHVLGNALREGGVMRLVRIGLRMSRLRRRRRATGAAP